MTALGPDGTAYVTQAEAEVILQRLFNGVHSQMVGLNTETRGLVDQLRLDVQQAIIANEASAEKQVETLRSQSQSSVSELDAKLAAADTRLATAVESDSTRPRGRKRRNN